MRKFRNTLFIAAVLAALCCGGGGARAAGGPGSSGLAIMKHCMGARPISLGEAYVAVADDVYAMQYNPAGILSVNGIEMVGMKMRKYVSGMEYQYAGFVYSNKEVEFIEDPGEAPQKTSESFDKLKMSIMALMTREELISYAKEQLKAEEESMQAEKAAQSAKEQAKKTPGTSGSGNKFSFGAGVMDFNAGEVTVEYEDPSEESRAFASAEHDYIASVTGAMGNETYGVGLNIKYVDSSLLDRLFRANAIAVDIGGIYRFQNITGEGIPFTVGACIQNLGFMQGYSDVKDVLPITSRIGVSTKFNMNKIIEVDMDVMPVVEWVRPVDVHPELHVGCEASTELREFSGDRIMIRVGYKTGEDITDTLVVGLGLKMANFQIDASASPLSFAGINFGGLENDLLLSMIIRF